MHQMRETARRVARAAFMAAIPFVPGSTLQAGADVPLHRRIDAAIEEASVGSMGKQTNDYEFLRRLYLNLCGRIPSVDELCAFVDDPAPNKRGRVIDELLASEECDTHFVRFFDVMLMERRNSKRVPQEDWTAFLKTAVSEKWSFDRIVQEIIEADGSEPHRGAAKFLLEREVEPNALTRDVGRIFFGRDLQCAQCHDHPNISDYEQSEYYGIFAFVNRSYLFEDAADANRAFVGEKAEGEAEFQSVFAPDDGATAAVPTLLDELALDLEPKTLAGDPYVVAPSKMTRAIPRFSRRTQLARLITHPQNEHFAKNVVNRLWAHMLGRGLVHPLDFHHGENAATHPALLKMLADEFVAMGFDYRQLVKQIALSSTFQRAIDLPVDQPSLDQLESRAERWQQELNALPQTTTDESIFFETRLARRRDQLTKLDQTIDGEANEKVKLETARGKLQALIADGELQVASKQEQIKALRAAATATKQASDLQPEDTALTMSVNDLGQRIAELEDALTAKQKEIEQLTNSRDELSTRLVTQERRIALLQAKRIGLADMVAEARGALSVFSGREKRQLARRNELSQRLAAITLLRDYYDALTKYRALTDESRQLTEQAKTAMTRLSAARGACAAPQDSLSAVKKDVDASAEELARMEKSLRQREEILSGLAILVADFANDGPVNVSDAGVVDVALSVLQKRQQKQANDTAKLRVRIAAQRSTTETLRARLSSLRAADAKARARLKREEERHDEVQRSAEQTRELLERASNELSAAEQRMRESAERRLAVMSLSALTPEQLAGATIEALGLRQKFQREAAAEWAKSNQKQSNAEEAGKVQRSDDAQRSSETAGLYQKRVDAVVNTYISMFAAPGGAPQDVFSATADQALFLANDRRVQGWLSAGEGTLLERLQSMSTSDQLVDELYLSILSRPPSDVERQELAEYLSGRSDDRDKALQEVAWGLLTSLEFRFNH